MKIYVVFVLSLMAFIISCKKKETTYNLSIPKPKLINILTDIYIAETTVKEHSSKNKDSLKNLYFTEIYEIHKIKEEDLKSNLDKLSRDFQLNEQIQKEVLDSLKKIQTYKYRPEIR